MISSLTISENGVSTAGSVKRNHNQLAFGISLIVFQSIVSILYGIYGSSPTQYINVSSIISAILLSILVIVGFGLYLSYLSKLIWTSIGYSFLIVAVTIQLYPLANAFWSKVSLFPNSLSSDSFSSKGFSLFLANFDSYQATGNTITGALKCALAIVVGFTGIIGRCGPLQVLVFTILSTIAYELNRQLAAKIGQDNFGSFTIFGFGGFLSFGSGIIYFFREARQQIIISRIASKFQASLSLSLVGTLFIFLLCPILAFQGDNSIKKEAFTAINSSISVIFSMSASVITNVAMNLLLKGELILRDIQNGLLAGIVAGGSAGYYVTNYAFALICGFSAGILHPLFYLYIQKRLYQYLGICCTYAPGVFALQSIVGATFTCIYGARVNNGLSDLFVYTNTDMTVGAPFGICFASIGIGFITGVVQGMIAFFINSNEPQKKFDDKYFWIGDNCISFTAPNALDSQIIAEADPSRVHDNLGIEEDGFEDALLWRDIL